MDPSVKALLIFLGLAVLVGGVWLAYDAYYRRQVNRALQGEGLPAPIPEPRKVGKLLLGLAAAACVIAFLIWASRLSSRLQELEYEVYSRMVDLSDQIREDHWRLVDQMQEEEKLFSSFDSGPVAVDTEERTVLYWFGARPKHFTENTEFSLRVGDWDLPMTRWEGDTAWNCWLTIPLEDLRTDQYLNGVLVVSENGVEQTEAVGVSFRLSDAIPRAFCGGRGGVTDGVTTSINGSVTLENGFCNAVSAVLRLYDGDQLLQEWNVTDDLYASGNSLSYFFDFPLEKPLAPGKIAMLHVVYTDDHGLTYDDTNLAFLGGEGTSEAVESPGMFTDEQDEAYCELGNLIIWDQNGEVILRSNWDSWDNQYYTGD